ncbi:MAG: hypothetical protein HC769_10485 [Cyanobacteria bacterium CRU_2_1]|nr:hypothetical protein [Cyanobacteria bacterium CRU_2_1]
MQQILTKLNPIQFARTNPQYPCEMGILPVYLLRDEHLARPLKQTQSGTD